MYFESIDPATGTKWQQYAEFDSAAVENALAQTAAAAVTWRRTPLDERVRRFQSLAQTLRQRATGLAQLVTREMGKRISESASEVEKCAVGCEYYAGQAEAFLGDAAVATDAKRSMVTYEPLGTVLAVMPWNFPLWQVLRCAVPAMIAGNTVVLKHAANVPGCALEIEKLFDESGFPPGAFRTLLIRGNQVADVIADRRIHAVSVTGSEAAGRSIAAAAGAHLKKSVLELGGSDPFIVLPDADLDLAASVAVQSRFGNAGQSCIAAKRFIVTEPVYGAFLERLRQLVEGLLPGDPNLSSTTLAPMARGDLRDELHRQVQVSVAGGAKLICGGQPLSRPGYFFAATVLTNVQPGTPAHDEELFGPVATVFRVADAAAAVELANSSRFGLGASIWTRDTAQGERLAREIQAGSVFVNGLVKSDPRLPFGGVKDSGYGRELAEYGLREFVNIKTVWIG